MPPLRKLSQKLSHRRLPAPLPGQIPQRHRGALYNMVGVPGNESVQMDADCTEARHAMMRGTRKVAVVTAAWQCMHFALAPVLVTCGQAAAPWGQPLTSGEGIDTIDLGSIDAAQVTWHVNAHAQDAHACVD